MAASPAQRARMRDCDCALQSVNDVHIVGIGGAGMSAIARFLRDLGKRVHGSDRRTSSLTEALQAEGIPVMHGHAATNIGEADLVLASSAVPEDNTELEAARSRGIRVARRPAFLRDLTASHDVIAIAGAHGKTTVTGMVASVLKAAGLDPSYIVGGVVADLETNGRAGSGRHFVIEADEYRRTFLALRPRIAVVTNVEYDHPDCYPSMRHLRLAFGDFVDNLVPDGVLVASGDDSVARTIAASYHANGGRVVLYGVGDDCSWHAARIASNERGGLTFTVQHAGDDVVTVALQIPGTFNVVNALAVFAVCDRLGIDPAITASALEAFRGTARRFEILGEVGGVTVIDDYAHHPTQIRAVLEAARDRYRDRRLIAVWEPHTFSRIRALCDEFATAFAAADKVLVMPIYAAREADDGTLTSDQLAQEVVHPAVEATSTLDGTVARLANTVRLGDVVLLMGAGDETIVGRRLIAALSRDHRPGSGQALASLGDALADVAERNAPLAPHSWLGIGGPADLLVVARERDVVVHAVQQARRFGVPWRVYGGFTNILVPDAGLRGLVVLNQVRGVRFRDSFLLDVDAGAIVAQVAREAVKRGWAGLTWAVGLPGTVGGAVVNNAGAFGGEIAGVLRYADILAPDGTTARVNVDWFDYRYRCSKLKGAGQRWLVLGAGFQLRRGDPQRLTAKASEYAERRRRTQPPGRTLGSTFKNPPGDYAGRLIEAAGLKGARQGGVIVSPHHANFLINEAGGTAAEFRALVERVQTAVRQQYGVQLEPEIEILPEAAQP